MYTPVHLKRLETVATVVVMMMNFWCRSRNTVKELT
jgi:hypothetical protein